MGILRVSLQWRLPSSLKGNVACPDRIFFELRHPGSSPREYGLTSVEPSVIGDDYDDEGDNLNSGPEIVSLWCCRWLGHQPHS